jgi:hypothetical protein
MGKHSRSKVRWPRVRQLKKKAREKKAALAKK